LLLGFGDLLPERCGDELLLGLEQMCPVPEEFRRQSRRFAERAFA
jgi:hypothetical protein